VASRRCSGSLKGYNPQFNHFIIGRWERREKEKERKKEKGPVEGVQHFDGNENR